MALDFLKLHDKALAKNYSARPTKDPTPARRNRVIEGIDRMLAAFKAGEAAPKRGWYSVRGDVARAQIKHGNRPISINGEHEFFVPRERLLNFYQDARKACQAGDLDQHINASVTGGTAAKQTTTRKPRNETPEQKAARTAKRMATLARKKAEAASNR